MKGLSKLTKGKSTVTHTTTGGGTVTRSGTVTHTTGGATVTHTTGGSSRVRTTGGSSSRVRQVSGGGDLANVMMEDGGHTQTTYISGSYGAGGGASHGVSQSRGGGHTEHQTTTYSSSGKYGAGGGGAL